MTCSKRRKNDVTATPHFLKVSENNIAGLVLIKVRVKMGGSGAIFLGLNKEII